MNCTLRRFFSPIALTGVFVLVVFELRCWADDLELERFVVSLRKSLRVDLLKLIILLVKFVE